MSDAQNTLDNFAKDWAEFKKTNDTLLSAKAEGKSVADLEAKLSKINANLDAAEEIKRRVDLMETAIKRNAKDTSNSTPADESKAAHRAAFNTWMRKGTAEEGRGGPVSAALHEMQTKALAVHDDTAGGFMVHADLSGRIVKKIWETSPIRQYASVQTISTDALEGPLDYNQSDAGWVEENGVRGQTGTPAIGMWRIPTHELYAMPAATQKLLDDAAWDTESWLADKVADRFARIENAAFVAGNGVTQPKGFLSWATVAETAANDDFFQTKKIGYVPTGTADDFAPVPSSGANPAQADALISMVYALKTQYRETAGTAFAMHRTTFGRVRRLRDNLGNYLWQPGLGGTPSTLLGYPIAEFNDMPILGATNKFGLAFANWRAAYQIVDRIGIRVLRDPFTSKPFVLFYSTKRTGGDIVNPEAIKLLKFATT